MQKICQVRKTAFSRHAPQPLKIIFFGTPEFGATILEKLVESGYKPILVVTAPDKKVGRKQILTPPPVKVVAEKYGIPVLQSEDISPMKAPGAPITIYENAPGALNKIQDTKPDLVVVAAYGKILPKEILDIPKYDALNVHPSLLPKYRGASPIQAAILNGDEKTGVTIIQMTGKMDAGPIISKSNIENQISNITYEVLSKKLAKLGAELLIETIPKWINDEIKPREQNESKASYAKIIKKEDGHINWDKSAQEIERRVRAFNPWPGTFASLKIKNQKGRNHPHLPKIKNSYKKIKIHKTALLQCQENEQPGMVFLTENKEMAVQTGKDCLILKEIQLEGKRKMNSQEFLRGHQNIIGSILQ